MTEPETPPNRVRAPTANPRPPHGGTPIVFVTVCAQHRRPLFARPEIHELLCRAWDNADAWRVGRYVLMLDHSHLFCAPAQWDRLSLGKWVQYWSPWRPNAGPIRKNNRSGKGRFGTSNCGGGTATRPSGAMFATIPSGLGLCAKLEEWLFQGEPHVLLWYNRQMGCEGVGYAAARPSSARRTVAIFGGPRCGVAGCSAVSTPITCLADAT